MRSASVSVAANSRHDDRDRCDCRFLGGHPLAGAEKAGAAHATVDLFDLRIANGLGGKSFFSLTGEVSDVRSSIATGARSAEEGGHLTRQVVIPRPHPDLVRHL